MSGDNAFFEELQTDFLNESAFMLEQYEEYMINLENSSNPVKELTDIFRVAHSVKGGAAAVGLPDLAKFAHVMEDLLDLLRSRPDLVNPEVISLLLTSGDELKNRVSSLQAGKSGPWDPSDLVAELSALIDSLSDGSPRQAHSFDDSLPSAGDNFFPAASSPAPSSGESGEDVVNYDLLAELMGNLSPEELAEVKAKEESEKSRASAVAPAPQASSEVLRAAPQASAPMSAPSDAKPAPALKAVKNAEPQESQSGKGGNGKSGKGANVVIKVDTGRVDSVLDAVGELVVLKNQLVYDETVRNGQNLRLEAIVDQLDKAVRELYEKTLSIRMTPLKSMFVKIQRIVRDLSLTLDKPVDLNLVGEETEVERTVFEILGDPLVHLVRNSMDHGIEKRETREQRGKAQTAKVTVSAKQNGGNVIIEIIDDGGGINREKVLSKAIERGLVPQGVNPADIPDEQVYQFIFQPGFSTADKISDLSGRGVGLDVVKSNLEKINGKINIYSKAGVGTTFRLTIPLTTAITDGIIVAFDGARYILPIHSIREIVRVVNSDFARISKLEEVARIRGALVPVINVNTTLGKVNWSGIKKDAIVQKRKEEMLADRSGETLLVIIEAMANQMAFPVDDVLGQAQVVVKPLSAGQNIPEVAGAATLGDGRTVLILDPSALINRQGRFTERVA